MLCVKTGVNFLEIELGDKKTGFSSSKIIILFEKIKINA